MTRNIFISSLLASAAVATTIQRRADVWQPAVGTSWQIMLSAEPNMQTTLKPDVPVWDLDLFDTDESTISQLHNLGKKVICYYSAGTYESGRPDLSGLKRSDIGASLPDWPGEYYLDIRSPTVWKVMQGRIQLAAQKGCDAVDPDNMGKHHVH
jgi:hypothetical protein